MSERDLSIFPADSFSLKAARELLDTPGKNPVHGLEKEAEYMAMRDQALVQWKPRDFYESKHVRSYVDLMWKVARYQCCETEIINIGIKAALASLIDEFMGIYMNDNDREEAISDWFSGTEKRAALMVHFRPYNIDEDSVAAQALPMQSAQLARISEMRTRAEVQAAAHVREIERYREARAYDQARLNPPEEPARERTLSGVVQESAHVV